MAKTASTEVESPSQALLMEGALTKKAARSMVAEARRNGVDLDAILPVAYAAFRAPGAPGMDDDAAYLAKSVWVTPVINPLFEARMLTLGAERRGVRSFAIPVGPDAPAGVLARVVEALPADVCASGKHADAIERRGFHAITRRGYAIGQDLAWSHFIDESHKTGIIADQWMMHRYFGYGTHPQADLLAPTLAQADVNAGRTARATQGILVSVGPGLVWLRLCTVGNIDRKTQQVYAGAPNTDLFRVKNRREPVAMTPDRAVALMERLAEAGVPTVDADGIIAAARQRLAGSVVVRREPGSPAQAVVAVGCASRTTVTARDTDAIEQVGATTVAYPVLVAEAARVSEAIAPGTRLIADPAVVDVAHMATARPVDVEGLRPYQQQAVGLHATTTVGYVNACAPGLGKTVMALSGLRAAAGDGWMGLVACPAPIRSQWLAEAAKFFPEAHTIAPKGKTVATTLADGMREARAAGQPMLAVVTYDTMRTNAEALAAAGFDDFILDEAAILTSTGSGRTKAAWEVRKGARRAVALTGTPIEKSLDDLGRIVAWARGDEEMFYGQRLSQRFDVTDDAGVVGLWDALGPTVYRRDRSELADELPAISTECVLIDPTPAEAALAEGARRELRRMYEDLLARVEAVQAMNPNDPALAKAGADLRAARGAMLGGVTLARMAACDPMAVAGSDSPAALLLRQAGLVAGAEKSGGTKRAQIVDLVADLTARGEKVLVFTDFSTVCRHLASDLAERGVRVGTFSGDDTEKRRTEAVKAYQEDGTLDCLVLTGAAREGLNLQRTTVLVHFDLPWLPSQVVQRVGRAARFGSTAERLQVLMPIMAGTIEERVAAVLVPRAVTALAALDCHRGVAGRDTEVGLALAGLSEAVSEDEQAGSESFFDLARQIMA